MARRAYVYETPGSASAEAAAEAERCLRSMCVDTDPSALGLGNSEPRLSGFGQAGFGVSMGDRLFGAVRIRVRCGLRRLLRGLRRG